MYYNYHAQIKKLIENGNLTKYKIYEKWNNISPALVLFFDNHKPMPVRIEKWDYYFEIIKTNEKK